MNIQNLHGAALMIIGVAWLLGGCALYFLINGVFEMGAAVISLSAFIALAVVVWRRPSDESAGRGPQG